MDAAPDPGEACLNCGRTAPGRYCPDCGQAKRVARPPLRLLLRELAESHMGLDSRLPRSLLPLVFRPGALTRDYLAGHRAAQVSPVRMYLVLSVVLFTLFSFRPPENVAIYVGGELVRAPEEDSGAGVQGTIDLFDAKSDALFRPFVGDSLEERRERLKEMDPELLAYRFFDGLQRGVPTGLILSLPLFALLLKLLYLGRGALYYDHFVFVLHSQAFLFLLLCLASFPPSTRLLWLGVALVAALHAVLSMKRVYARSWPGTLARYGVLLGGYLVLGLAIFIGVSVRVMLTL